MKAILIRSVSLFMLSVFIFSLQDTSAQNKKLTRKELREIRKAQMEANYYRLDSALNERSFVLEADYLRNKDGVNIPVLSDFNFIMVNKSEGVLQTGSGSGSGNNGVGGVTTQGIIEKWEVSGDTKNLTYTVRFSLISNLGNFDVVMFVGADNHATATITGLGSGRLTWSGYLESIRNSRIFRGQRTL
ncbi:MAG: DUF4251 domain-containing protein [Bacteroidia bacterium]|nr:DUF4251 domain-containing protein [Bacteroidia bacterium]